MSTDGDASWDYPSTGSRDLIYAAYLESSTPGAGDEFFQTMITDNLRHGRHSELGSLLSQLVGGRLDKTVNDALASVAKLDGIDGVIDVYRSMRVDVGGQMIQVLPFDSVWAMFEGLEVEDEATSDSFGSKIDAFLTEVIELGGPINAATAYGAFEVGAMEGRVLQIPIEPADQKPNELVLPRFFDSARRYFHSIGHEELGQQASSLIWPNTDTTSNRRIGGHIQSENLGLRFVRAAVSLTEQPDAYLHCLKGIAERFSLNDSSKASPVVEAFVNIWKGSLSEDVTTRDADRALLVHVFDLEDEGGARGLPSAAATQSGVDFLSHLVVEQLVEDLQLVAQVSASLANRGFELRLLPLTDALRDGAKGVKAKQHADVARNVLTEVAGSWDLIRAFLDPNDCPAVSLKSYSPEHLGRAAAGTFLRTGDERALQAMTVKFWSEMGLQKPAAIRARNAAAACFEL